MEGVLKQKKNIKKIFFIFTPHSLFSSTSNDLLINPNSETPQQPQPKKSYLIADDLIK